MATAGWMDRVKTDLTRRREDLLAAVSQRALDALEAVERVEDTLARAPYMLRDWRTKAADRLEAYARRQGVNVDRERVDINVEVEVRRPEPFDMPHRQEREAPSAPKPEKSRTAGRKSVQSPTSARRVGVQGKKKKGFVVKRGQKHAHDR